VKRNSIRGPARPLGHQVGQFQRTDLAAAPRNLVVIGRYVLGGGDAMEDVVAVDGGDCGYVVVAR
jgi:hypothetical protein